MGTQVSDVELRAAAEEVVLSRAARHASGDAYHDADLLDRFNAAYKRLESMGYTIYYRGDRYYVVTPEQWTMMRDEDWDAAAGAEPHVGRLQKDQL